MRSQQAPLHFLTMAVLKLRPLRRLCELNVVRQVFNVWCACAYSCKQASSVSAFLSACYGPAHICFWTFTP